jgi:hypothetical protein
MLGFPFFSGMLLARNADWDLVPAAVAVLAVFLIREPILVLSRQRFVWTDLQPRTLTAQRALLVVCPALVISTLWLSQVLPLGWFAALGAVAAILLAIDIHAVARKRGRSVGYQVAGAAGLAGSAAVAYLAGGREPDLNLALLWAVHTIHGTASVLVVHAGIEARKMKPHTGGHRAKKQAAIVWHVVHAVVAAVFALAGRPGLTLALLVPWFVHILDLLRLDRPSFLRIPLRGVGLRELALSTGFTVLVLAALW